MTTDDPTTEPSLKKPPPAIRSSSSSSARPPKSPQPPRVGSPPAASPSGAAAGTTTTANGGVPPLPTGNLPPAIVTDSTKKTEGGGHKRIVSWGALTQTLLQPQLPSSSGHENEGVASGRITQQDLAERMPTESEGESFIVNSLDNIDPTIKGKPSEKSVLSNISDADLKAINSNDESTQQSVRSAERRSTRSTGSKGSKKHSLFKVATAVRAQQHHRRKETMGDKLQGLAAAMDAVHLQHLDFLDDHDGPPVPAIDISETKPISSSADAFQHNTNLLFQRHASRRASKRGGMDDAEVASTAPSPYLSSTPGDMNASQSISAEKRWKMLKHAVVATRMSNMANEETNNNNNDTILEVPDATDDQHGKETSESESSEEDDASGRRKVKRRGRKRGAAEKVLRDLQDLVAPRSFTTYLYFKIGIFFIMLPSATIAAILFYFGGNPPTGVVDLNRSANGTLYNKNGDVIGDDTASASWWLLFLGVRQVSVLLLAKLLEMIVIDVLSVRSKFSVKVFGPWATLFLLQTKGWPFMSFAWGMLSVGLLSGSKPFFHHWAYWQDAIGLFNERNPSGEIVNSSANHRLTAVAIALGVIVSCKRFWLGLYLGRQTFAQFSDRLAAVMKKILLVSEVASLGRAFERYVSTHKDVENRRTVSATYYGVNRSRLEGMISTAPEDDSPDGRSTQDALDTANAKYVIDPGDRHPMTGQLSHTQRARILTLLGQWAEPTLAEKVETNASVNEILQFRRALEYLHTSYPFSGSFGLADRRESVIESAQEVYDRLLLRSPDPDVLHFDVVALLGVRKNGELDSDKLKDLIKLFRPDRDGTMECVNFVKSIDEVYKELRLLRASVANSSKIDRAFESIFNIVFYVVLACLILSQLGYDPLALFLSISGVVLAFAFMIGAASSKYFEGLLFILARRPYQIGDGIALSGVNEQVSFTGSPMWVVEDVDLFTTKLVFSFTGERATVSNGSLAASRVINATISKEAQLYVLVKFPIDVSFQKLQLFREQLTEFFKNRPREWIAFTRFRSTRFEINEGYVEYIVCAQHRLAWSSFGDLMQSKADLMHFCMELQKSMNLVFKQPPQPVDVSIRNGGNLTENVPLSPFQPPSSPGSGSLAPDNPKFIALQSMFAPKSD